MNYTFYDSPSEEVAVVLPGFGSFSVHYEFDAFRQKIADKYKVILFEPLGYGLSDKTDRPRTSENICNELHEVMTKLGYDRYTLISHSISGIYMLKYANMFEDEVVSCIGIDSSVPDQMNFGPEEAKPDNVVKFYKRIRPLITTGIYRVMTESSFDSDVLTNIPTITDEDDKKKALALSCIDQLNDTQLDEMVQAKANMSELLDKTFPESVPVLFLLSKTNCETLPEWKPAHEKLMSAPGSLTIQIEGGHYLHYTSLDDITDQILSWEP